ncbi:MAG: hypothetical protein IKT98_04870 [Selenomonadaceae bacterium]|nr:hypothetical protein [Selenomonadaceae bacterium]
MVVDGVKINFVGIDDYTREEAANYLAYVKERTSIPVKIINVKACEDGLVDVSYTARGEKFERIRRITG